MKKKVLFIFSLIFAFLLGACAVSTVSAEQTNPLKIWYQNSNGAYHTLLVEDDFTGVNYVVVSTERGNGEYAISITPRLNADGTLYVNKK